MVQRKQQFKLQNFTFSSEHATADRINFSNQQLYLLFSYKTRPRRVAVYVETQYSSFERQVTQLFTYLLTHKLLSSCIPRYLVSRACD